MANCPKCGKELKPNAKFCGGCGTKLESVAASAVNKCPHCGKELKPNAKFCGGCGTKLEQSSPVQISQGKDFSLIANYIRWNMLEGQIAVKIDENDIAAYGKVKGLSIQEGVRALIFVGGKLVTELTAGSYAFKDLGASDIVAAEPLKNEANVTEQKAKNNFLSHIGNFFSNIAGNLTGRNRERAEAAGLTSRVNASVPPVTIVLVRDVKFPLVFSFQNIETANLASDVGLHLLCQIANLNDFYQAQLLDKKFVCYDTFSKDLELAVRNIINVQLSTVSPTQVAGNMNLNASILPHIQAAVKNIYSYVDVVNVLNLTAKNDELAALRRLKDELYISEQELTQLQHRNDFLNRMQDVNNAQALHEAQTKVDFIAAMDKIDQQNELNQFERDKFSQMLIAQRQILEATSNEEVAIALQEIKKSGLLREEEIENLQHIIAQRQDLRNASDQHILNMAILANERDEERLKLLWELEVGTKRLENELQLQQMRDEYGDSRREADLDYNSRARRSEIELDKEEQLNQLDLLRQAQAIREERENAEHRRAEEALASARAHEMQMTGMTQQHEQEMRRIFQNMSAEQIMAANPDLTPEAAAAMAEKFKAEAAAVQNSKETELMRQQIEMANQNKNDMMTFMQQMMAQQNAMNMQQMNMMRDISVANAGQNANFQQQMMAAKQAELEHTRADSNANQDRFLAGMQTTIQSMGKAFNTTSQVSVAPTADSATQKNVAGAKCRSCGAILDTSALFCDECGASV